MPKMTIPEMWLQSTPNHITSRFEISTGERGNYEAERSLLDENISRRKERPSSSAGRAKVS